MDEELCPGRPVTKRSALRLQERDSQNIPQHELDLAGRMVALDANVAPLVHAPPDTVRAKDGRCRDEKECSDGSGIADGAGVPKTAHSQWP